MVDISESSYYRINVLDVVENWGGYPLQDPCVANPAKNSGVVEVRCFINNFCPFIKSDMVDIPLVFNNRTLANILPDFPAIYRNSLTTTEGTEGVHFTPRYVFRNNYLYKIKDEFTDIVNQLESDFGGELAGESLFDRYYEEINDGRGQIPGADNTRYKKEQSWVVVPSVFDTEYTNEEGEDECIRAKWSYDIKDQSESGPKMEDLEHDYTTEVYNQFRDSIVQNENGEWVLKENTSPALLPRTIQFPKQVRVTDQLGEGVHWRVKKRTPLYRGEDFFIKFVKIAKSSAVKKVSTEIPKFNIGYYSPLDVTSTNHRIWDPSFPDFKLPENQAVKSTDDNDEREFSKYYDFSSQPYYIIEVGHRGPDNFFIIIAERISPICVHIQKGISRILGEPFQGITGKALLDAPEFTITVRNHLNKLAVYFDGPTLNIEPWIITKEDLEIELEEGTNYPVLNSKPSKICVPRGDMLIWGGNIKCGFIFGPLQYASPEAGFVYPPRKVTTEEELVVSVDSDGKIILTGDDGELGNPFSLPLDTDHNITFSLPEVDRYDFDNNVSTNDGDFVILSKNEKVSMFTQDAQYFRDFIDKADGTVDKKSRYGSYFYRETLKEIGYSAVAKSGAKTSGITVIKYRFSNNESTNYQMFDTIIHMLVGDHVFNLDGETYDESKPDTGNGKPTWVRQGELSDDEWLIADCKTPIMTGIRLVSTGGDNPRWDDGTTLDNGMGLTPFDNASPYFIDATDHVLNYSDSWSATGYSQIDHTGSINFLLGIDYPFENNVTDNLYALQNKTFYIEIWAGYRDCNYTQVPGFYKMFTGLCHGGQINYEYGKHVMSCKVVDFTEIMNDMLFFNSPFFDGLRDINAIDEILKMSGFRWKGPVDPGNLVHKLTQNSNNNSSTVFFRHIDGRSFKMEPYALPSGYNRLDQPMFKFKEGTSYLDGIREISSKSAKVFFFDQLGIAHYEDLGDLIEQDFQGKMPLDPLYYFTTNPEIFQGQIVFNSVEHSYAVQDVFNHIKILSNTPDMHLLLLDRINFESLDNPDLEGFRGYKRTFFQQEGMFGSKAAVNHAANKYSVMFRPYVEYRFETYGVPLRANDIVQINGENARVMSVNHEFDPTSNRWWMQVECKRYQPIGVPVNQPRP